MDTIDPDNKWCPECEQLLSRSLFKQNVNRIAAYCTPCGALRRRRWHMAKRYGITLEDYARMYDAQGGKCALCNKPYNVLAVDHDHATGRVRGLLCNPCNRAIAYVEDKAWMTRAEAYLEV